MIGRCSLPFWKFSFHLSLKVFSGQSHCITQAVLWSYLRLQSAKSMRTCHHSGLPFYVLECLLKHGKFYSSIKFGFLFVLFRGACDFVAKFKIIKTNYWFASKTCIVLAFLIFRFLKTIFWDAFHIWCDVGIHIFFSLGEVHVCQHHSGIDSEPPWKSIDLINIGVLNQYCIVFICYVLKPRDARPSDLFFFLT